MTDHDRNLVFLHCENSRRKIKEVGHFTGKSPQRVAYSLSRYRERGIIGDAHAVIDYSYFGVLLFRVYFSGGYVSERDKTGILRKLKAHPHVVSIWELDGAYDLVIEMQAPNPSRFNKELRALIRELPMLNQFTVVLNLVSHDYPARYLLTKRRLAMQVKQDRVIGGDRAVGSFSRNEKLVLGELITSPLSRYSAISARLGLNVKTVISTLSKLERMGVYKGVKSVYVGGSEEPPRRRVLLKLHNTDPAREQELLSFFLSADQVVRVNKTIGDWDIEVDIGGLKPQAIRKFIVELREEFKDIIQEFNSCEIISYHFIRALAAYLLPD